MGWQLHIYTGVECENASRWLIDSNMLQSIELFHSEVIRNCEARESPFLAKDLVSAATDFRAKECHHYFRCRRALLLRYALLNRPAEKDRETPSA